MEFSTFLLIMIINVVWSVMFIWSGMRKSQLKEELKEALESSNVAYEAYLRKCRELEERDAKIRELEANIEKAKQLTSEGKEWQIHLDHVYELSELY